MNKVLVANKKARFDYDIIEVIEAGLVLNGAEVKSLRAGSGSLKGSYVIFPDGRPKIRGLHIAEYKFSSSQASDPFGERDLLLNLKEIKNLLKYEKNTGISIIPLNLHLKKGMIKVDIAIAKGRKSHDKKQVLKDRSEKKRIDKVIKNFNQDQW